MSLKYKNTKVIEVGDWDDLVEKTYGRPYSFQQQDGCQSRGTVNITIPDGLDEEEEYDYDNDTIPEVVNGDEMGVKFEAWLARDPKQKLKDDNNDFSLELFWARNFYPNLQIVANDLYKKGLIEADDYVINIDW
jgi:hypothetical protein